MIAQMQVENQHSGESTRRSSQGRSGWLKFALSVEKRKSSNMENIRPANAVHVGDYEKDNMIQQMWKWQKNYTNIRIKVGDNLGYEFRLWQKRVRTKGTAGHP